MIELAILRGLAIFVIAHLLVNERGTWGIFEQIRTLFGVMRFEDADADDINEYSRLIGVEFHELEEPVKWIAVSEAGLALLCMICTGVLVAPIVVIISIDELSFSFFFEALSAIGVHFLIVMIMERVRGVE